MFMIFLFHDTSAPWSYLQISSFWGRYSTKLDNALIVLPVLKTLHLISFTFYSHFFLASAIISDFLKRGARVSVCQSSRRAGIKSGGDRTAPLLLHQGSNQPSFIIQGHKVHLCALVSMEFWIILLIIFHNRPMISKSFLVYIIIGYLLEFSSTNCLMYTLIGSLVVCTHCFWSPSTMFLVACIVKVIRAGRATGV